MWDCYDGLTQQQWEVEGGQIRMRDFGESAVGLQSELSQTFASTCPTASLAATMSRFGSGKLIRFQAQLTAAPAARTRTGSSPRSEVVALD